MYSFALHGGAGAHPDYNYDREIAHMAEVSATARLRLEAGTSALDVVCEAINAMEASGLYVAGRGASPNSVGLYELDASLMMGPSQKAGAVGALQGIQSPIKAARLVMEATPHVFLVGDGARELALAHGLERIDAPEDWYLRAGLHDENHLSGELAHGTVGAVCLDSHGHLAAATSTAGVFGKRHGRIGDTPVIGAGTWADSHVAVSCTGQGEYFLRVSAASQIAFRCRTGQALTEAAETVLGEIGSMGGNGGLIAIDHQGNITLPYNSRGMKRASFTHATAIVSAAF